MVQPSVEECTPGEQQGSEANQQLFFMDGQFYTTDSSGQYVPAKNMAYENAPDKTLYRFNGYDYFVSNGEYVPYAPAPLFQLDGKYCYEVNGEYFEYHDPSSGKVPPLPPVPEEAR